MAAHILPAEAKEAVPKLKIGITLQALQRHSDLAAVGEVWEDLNQRPVALLRFINLPHKIV